MRRREAELAGSWQQRPSKFERQYSCGSRQSAGSALVASVQLPGIGLGRRHGGAQYQHLMQVRLELGGRHAVWATKRAKMPVV